MAVTKILKNAYILTKLYQIAYFHDPKMKNKSIFKNWNFFGPPTKTKCGDKEFQFFQFFRDFVTT